MTIKGFFLIVLMLFASGCAREYVMPQQDMYLVPSLRVIPERITIAFFKQSPELDLAEGGEDRIAWPAIMFGKDGKEYKLLALGTDMMTASDCKKLMVIVIPHLMEEIVGNRLAVLDRGGSSLYNQRGEIRKLKSLTKKINLEKVDDFLVRIETGKPYFKEVSRGSENYEEIAAIYAQFRVKEVSAVRDYVYKKYGSSLSEAELDEIAKNDSIVSSFIDWAGRDWMAFLSVPFIGVEGTIATAGLVKVFTLPSIWGDKINQPGYKEFIPDAESTSRILMRGFPYYACAMDRINRK